MKKKMMRITVVLALVLVVAGMSAYATAGGKNDPLVSLSYLNETFLDTVTKKVQEMITSRDAVLKAELSREIEAAEREIAAEYGSGSEGPNFPGDYETTTFVVVTLEKGQTLVGKVGCELMLRVGSASCVADSSPGLVDTTAGSTLGGGKALAANHLYMATVDGRGVKAASDSVKVMVRGPYTIY